MTKRMSSAENCMMRIICAIALLFVGLGHQPPVIDKGAMSLSAVAQFTLPDGTLPDLCSGAEDDQGTHHRQGVASGCEACRLTAMFALPAPADAIGKPLEWQTLSFALQPNTTLPHKRLQPNTSQRGPPQSLLV